MPSFRHSIMSSELSIRIWVKDRSYVSEEKHRLHSLTHQRKKNLQVNRHKRFKIPFTFCLLWMNILDKANLEDAKLLLLWEGSSSQHKSLLQHSYLRDRIIGGERNDHVFFCDNLTDNHMHFWDPLHTLFCWYWHQFCKPNSIKLGYFISSSTRWRVSPLASLKCGKKMLFYAQEFIDSFNSVRLPLISELELSPLWVWISEKFIIEKQSWVSQDS